MNQGHPYGAQGGFVQPQAPGLFAQGSLPPPGGPMMMGGGGPGNSFFGPSEGVFLRRVFYLTVLFVSQAISFALLCALNNKLNILVHDNRSSIPTLLIGVMISCALSGLAVVIQIVYYLIKQNINGMTSRFEYVASLFAAGAFLAWLVLCCLLATKQPQGPVAYYCGTGSFQNYYCATVFHMLEGLTWTGTALCAVFALDCFFVGRALASMRK